MAGAAVLKVDIVADSSKAQKAFKDTDDSASSITGTMAKVGAAIGGAFAVKQVLDFASSTISAASDLNENLSKTTAVFGDWAIDIEQFAEGAAKAVGLSKSAALAATSDFGNMFTQMGLGKGDAMDLSTGMVTLAADFASFHNADITDVLAAQQAAFRGEYDSLQRFVPMINAAAVEQKALAMTGKATTKELTAQEKALATNALMLEGAGAAAGDFAKTSDGLANKTRIQAAEWDNMKTTIGTQLLPIQMALTSFMADKLIPAIVSLTSFLTENKDILLAVGIAIAAALVPALVAWLAAIIPVAIATVAAAAPVIALGAAVGVLAYLIVKHWDTITDAVKAALRWIGENWPLLLGILTGPIGLAVLYITRHWDDIKEIFSKGVQFIKDLAGDITDALTKPFRDAVRAIADLWNSTVGELSFEIPDWVPGLGGKGFDVPDIPKLASGGSVWRTGLAIVHRGETFSGVGRSTSSSGPTVVNIHVTTSGLGADAPQIQRAVADALRGYTARNGPLDIPVRTAS